MIQCPPYETSDIAGLIRFLDSEVIRCGIRLDWVDNKVRRLR